METPYKDKDGNIIKVGMTLYIAVNYYNGEYNVKFGEYTMEKFTKNDLQKVHCGFYLCNNKNIVSLAYAMSQPTGYLNSKHYVKILNTPIK